MLLFTISFGGLLLMMGHQSRSEALFYYFRLEDQVPENHLLRLIDRHVNFGFIRAKLKDAYSDAGRPMRPKAVQRGSAITTNYLVDNASCIIVGVQATPARLSQESVAARDMIERYRERYGDLPQTLAADTTYGNGELLQWLDERGITPYIRVKEGPNSPPDLYGIEKFTYVPEENCYLCPAGKPLNYVGINKRNRAHRYYSTVKRCRGCGQKPQCTRGKFRTIAIHTCEATRQKADEVAKTPEFAVALRKRRKVEALFSELKNLIGLRRLRLRRIKFVREQFYLAAVAQNLKRLVRFLNLRATSDGNRVSNRLPQEKHEPEETPLRENASSNRVFQHQRLLSTVLLKS